MAGSHKPENEPAKPKGSTADRHLDRFRAKARAQKQANATKKAKTTARVSDLSRRVPIIIFLVIWVIIWSSGILYVALLLIGGQGNLFLGFLEGLALIGWYKGLRGLINAIKGKRT